MFEQPRDKGRQKKDPWQYPQDFFPQDHQQCLSNAHMHGRTSSCVPAKIRHCSRNSSHSSTQFLYGNILHDSVKKMFSLHHQGFPCLRVVGSSSRLSYSRIHFPTQKIFIAERSGCPWEARHTPRSRAFPPTSRIWLRLHDELANGGRLLAKHKQEGERQARGSQSGTGWSRGKCGGDSVRQSVDESVRTFSSGVITLSTSSGRPEGWIYRVPVD